MNPSLPKCATCTWWAPHESPDWGYCVNEEKIFENSPEQRDPPPDCMIYSYNESGYFLTGKNFGCVHHQQ